MSILNWDNDELDVRGARASINNDLCNKTGGLYRVLYGGKININECSSSIISGNGELTFKTSCEINGNYPEIRQLVESGIINSIKCSGFNAIGNFALDGSNCTPLVKCNDVYICRVPKISNMKFQIDMNDNTQHTVHHSRPCYHSFKLLWSNGKFENVDIDFINGNTGTISIDCEKFINLAGLKSNAKIIMQNVDTGFNLTGLMKQSNKLKMSDIIPIDNFKNLEILSVFHKKTNGKLNIILYFVKIGGCFDVSPLLAAHAHQDTLDGWKMIYNF